jgi:hypothetical protein
MEAAAQLGLLFGSHDNALHSSIGEVQLTIGKGVRV